MVKYMRDYKIIIGVLLFLTMGCQKKSTNHPHKNQNSSEKKIIIEGKWEAFPLGDIDNDKISDTSFVYTPSYYGIKTPELHGEVEFDGCVGKRCYNRVRFTNNLPEIRIDNSLWGTVEPIADLDEDGINELVFQTNWWIGSHVQIKIYSFDKRKRKWVILASNSLYGQDSYKDRITKINKDKFKFKIEYMDTIEHDLMNKDTIMLIKK